MTTILLLLFITVILPAAGAVATVLYFQPETLPFEILQGIVAYGCIAFVSWSVILYVKLTSYRNRISSAARMFIEVKQKLESRKEGTIDGVSDSVRLYRLGYICCDFFNGLPTAKRRPTYYSIRYTAALLLEASTKRPRIDNSDLKYLRGPEFEKVTDYLISLLSKEWMEWLGINFEVIKDVQRGNADDSPLGETLQKSVETSR